MTNKTTSAIDLVERLRAIDPLEFDFSKDTNTLDEAADTIARLQAALERLGSTETMTTSFMRRDNAEGRELDARITFARTAISSVGGE